MSIPKVSILMLAYNSEQCIERSLGSALLQDYPNLEIVIQDGGSEDATCDIIRAMGDSRVSLVSEKDKHGASQGFYKGLKRCEGDIITLCWADEELFPHTVSWGVKQLDIRPQHAGIYGGVLASDFKGTVSPMLSVDLSNFRWDLEKFFCWEMFPNYVTSFFRRTALESSGFMDRVASYYEGSAPIGCIMYEYFCMPGLCFPIEAVPHFMGKFASHKDQLCAKPHILSEMIRQLENSLEYLLHRPDIPRQFFKLRSRALASFRLNMIPNLVLFRHLDTIREFIEEAASVTNVERIHKAVLPVVRHLSFLWRYDDALMFLEFLEEKFGLDAKLEEEKSTVLVRLDRKKEALNAIRRSYALDENAATYRKILILSAQCVMDSPVMQSCIIERLGKSAAGEKRLRELGDKLVELCLPFANLSERYARWEGFGKEHGACLLQALAEESGADYPELRREAEAALWLYKVM